MTPEFPDLLAGEIVSLRRYRLDDAVALKAAIAASHPNLRNWMPWAQQPPTDESVMAFLGPSVARAADDPSANYAITLPGSGELVGGCGLMSRVGPGALEIGYWVDTRHTGRGIATESARLLAHAALSASGIERVEIHCDEANGASAAVARRLGFRLDRVDTDAITAPAEVGRCMVWIGDAEWARDDTRA